MGVPFAEDEWVSRNRREELTQEQLSQLGRLPFGYYTVDDVTLRVVQTIHEPLREQGFRTIGWIPQYDAHTLGPQETHYFAFATANPGEDPILWPMVRPIQEIHGTGKVLEAATSLVRAADPLEYAESFAKGTGVCWRCGKALSREESIIRGTGPICWRRLGAEGDEYE